MPDKTYESILRQLVRRGMFHINPGLERVARVLSVLGNPQDRIPAIHIAGTNGKGSVAAMLESVLRHAGYHTGLYTSPHLCELQERIQIDRQALTSQDFTDTAKRVLDAEKVASTPLTYFEFVTAMAFLHFANEPVDIAIIETGLGGRWDATNVLKKPELSIITSIGRDHMQWLGKTEEAIAMEKAGIIKKNRPVVSGVQGLPGQIIAQRAARRKAPLHRINRDFQATAGPVHWEQGTQEIRYKSNGHRAKQFTVHLLGTHQITNSAVALTAVEQLRAGGWQISDRALRQGLLNVAWAGRFQIFHRLPGEPFLILDGAHNLPGIQQLLKTVALSPWSNVQKTFLFSVYKDKEYVKMIGQIAEQANQVVLWTLPVKRALRSTKVDKLFQKRLNKTSIHRSHNASDALRRAIAITPSDGLVIATGSLAFIGHLLNVVQTQDQLRAHEGRIPELQENHG